MYAALWRALPGPALLRAALLVVLLGAVVVACFEWLFPLVASWLPYDETTVGSDTGAALPGPSALPGPVVLPGPSALPSLRPLEDLA
ncbi:hypothetical protein [Knoellia aerolata]|uniref:Uncharacterized protein n=1 Tax=Knoellia aerolata DSM 18566 TaxID=1385519 RepID=A0A0A0K1I4_9MICO|nr:hypothetical protein [Knoellia aerolata]KGN41656.1 hypothetical protein N801_06535 [Knoellia aerolata DSM 18566]